MSWVEKSAVSQPSELLYTVLKLSLCPRRLRAVPPVGRGSGRHPPCRPLVRQPALGPPRARQSRECPPQHSGAVIPHTLSASPDPAFPCTGQSVQTWATWKHWQVSPLECSEYLNPPPDPSCPCETSCQMSLHGCVSCAMFACSCLNEKAEIINQCFGFCERTLQLILSADLWVTKPWVLTQEFWEADHQPGMEGREWEPYQEWALTALKGCDQTSYLRQMWVILVITWAKWKVSKYYNDGRFSQLSKSYQLREGHFCSVPCILLNQCPNNQCILAIHNC